MSSVSANLGALSLPSGACANERGPACRRANHHSFRPTRPQRASTMLLSHPIRTLSQVLWLVVTVAVPARASGYSAERYTESLVLSPLPDGKLHSHFSFNLTAPHPPNKLLGSAPNLDSLHHALLPTSLSALAAQYSVNSFHLTLSSGRWQPSWPGQSVGVASGIELVGWLEELEGETDEDERRRWVEFKGAIAGVFCTGVMGESEGMRDTSPDWGYRFDGQRGTEQGALPTFAAKRLLVARTAHLLQRVPVLTAPSHINH